MREDGAIAEHDDEHWQDKGEDSHGQAEAKKKSWAAVFHTEQAVIGGLHSSVQQGWDAKNQGAGPDCCTGGTDAPTAPQVPRVQQSHHGQVAIDTHTGKKENVGKAVHGNDVAAQLAQQVSSRPEVPLAAPAGRDGPQWQCEDEDEVGQGQVEDECVHQSPTSPSFAAHDCDYKEVAQKACEKYEAIHNGEEDVGALKVRVGTIQRETAIFKAIIVVIIEWIISEAVHIEGGSALQLRVVKCCYFILRLKPTEKNTDPVLFFQLSSSQPQKIWSFDCSYLYTF